MNKKSTDAEVVIIGDEATTKILPPGYVPLEHPIKRGDQVIDGVTLRKPDAGSLRGIKLMELLQMDVTSVSTLLPRITTPTLTPHDVSKLDPADIVSISTELLGFFLSKATRESLPA